MPNIETYSVNFKKRKIFFSRWLRGSIRVGVVFVIYT